MIKQWIRLLSATVLLSAVGAATVGAQNPTGGNPAKAEEKLLPSASLYREIRHELVVLPFYSVFDYVDFTLEGKKVTLTGAVLRLTLKEQAEGAVKSLEGVDTVVDHIEVLPVSPSDDELRDAIYRAIYEDPVLQKYAVHDVPTIHILVKNGNVTLEGLVESEADKNLAGARVKTVANVGGVRNNLMVHAGESAAQ